MVTERLSCWREVFLRIKGQISIQDFTKKMVSKEEFQGWILDYACYHRIYPIINAISLRHAGRLDHLSVPQLRLACATIHFIIKSEQLSQFDEAIKLVQQVNQALPPLLVCQKTYMRLLTGLKIKALFQQLEEDTDKALVKLNTYFPRSTPHSTNTNQGQTSKFNQNHKNFRCFFFSLVSNENQLRAYLKEDYDAEFGPKFMESIKKLCSRFLQQIESQLLPPMIEKVLACTECEKFSKISPATEMLLDYVHEKKLSSQSDPDTCQQNTAQQKEHRASLVFTEQELFEMLTVSYPLYTQDWLARDHGLNLSSQDLFESFDSQEALLQSYSQINSPHLIISNSHKSTVAPLVPLAGLQDSPIQPQQSLRQGSPENPLQECIQQPMQLQPGTHQSSLTSRKEPSEAHKALGVVRAEQQSAVVQNEVTQLQLAPEENRLQTPTIRGEVKTSSMETGDVQQCERIEVEMEITEAQPETEHQTQMIQDQVQPSERGSAMRHQSEMIQDEVRPSKSQAKTRHQSQMIQDQVRPSERDSAMRHQSEMIQDEVRPSKSQTKTRPHSQMIQDQVRPSERGSAMGHQSEMIQDEVRPSKSQTKTRPHSQMIQDQVRPSERGSAMGHQSEMIQDEVRPSKSQTKTRPHSQMIQDQVRPSERGSAMRHQSGMIQDEVRPSKSQTKTRPHSQMIQDQVRPSERGSAMGHQSEMIPDEVRPSKSQTKTRPHSQMVQDQVRPSERGFSMGHQSEMIQDEVQPSKSQTKTRPHSQMIHDQVRPSERGSEMGHQSEMIQNQVRPSKRCSKMGRPSEIKQNEEQPSKNEAKIRHQSRMIRDQVRPSKKSSEIGHSGMVRDVQSSKGESKAEHQSQIIQDEIQLSEMELEELRLSRMAAQDRVPCLSFTRQEVLQENLLPQSEVLERTLSELPKLPQDRPLQIGLPQHELHPQQEEPSPQTSLQITGCVHPSDSFNVVNVSPPLVQETDPAHITSTPIHHQKEPSPRIDQREKDHENQQQTPLLPTDPDPSPQGSSTQPKYIRPWMGYIPKQPSFKLLKSNVFKSCDVDDRNRQDAEMRVTGKKPDPSVETGVTEKRPDLSAVDLEKNSAKHSSEETSALCLPQSDKGSETLLSSWATSSSLRLSTDLSSISSGSCDIDIVSPSDSNSAEVFFMGTPEETIDSSYNFISKHLRQDVKACIIKLYRNQQLDVVDGEQIYSIYS